MAQDIIPYDNTTSLEVAGPAADDAARRNRLEKYQGMKAKNTLRRQAADIALFRQYLEAASIPSGDLFQDIDAWRGVTFGIVEGFREWMLQQGYSIGSTNVRLSTIKKYLRIAFESAVIADDTYRLIQSVKGYSPDEAVNVNERRAATGMPTRVGAKKEKPIRVPTGHLRGLKELLEQDESPTGIRDYLLVCLLGYQGLRCGEVTELKRSDVHLEEGELIFWRRKVKKVQIHNMHRHTVKAMRRYLEMPGNSESVLLFEGIDRAAWTDSKGRHHKAHKASDGLSTRAINDRVRYLGELVDIDGLSPHDLRHYWTFDAFRQKTPIDIVMQAGGWNSYAMPLRYRGDATVANEGIKQSE